METADILQSQCALKRGFFKFKVFIVQATCTLHTYWLKTCRITGCTSVTCWTHILTRRLVAVTRGYILLQVSIDYRSTLHCF